MNFDELQKQWDNQSSEDVKINPDLELNQKANTVIDKVRKTLKKDFFFQLTNFPLLLIYPYIFGLNTPLIWFIILCYIIIMILPLKNLIKFYNSSYRLEYNSLKNINWFYYNFKFSIEIFKLYTNVVTVLVIMFIGITFYEKYSEKDLKFILIFSIIFIPTYIISCIWMLKWWINKLYKKPLLELENILNQLEE
ncbi:hypothetical protein IF125_05320 [Empedobacter stercoris]|uniref:hypothetical protein n=1 Tax=Empedobacter stercoris TaxID=1628248 RepID=UPI001CE04BE3|nr:hypothetical protein [Empedobacter stercoris]MCA4781679.1 hypothetical protein [Empedobacter stercoris]